MTNNSNKHELINNNKISYDVISTICLIIAGKPASCLAAYPYNIIIHIYYNIIIHSNIVSYHLTITCLLISLRLGTYFNARNVTRAVKS